MQQASERETPTTEQPFKLLDEETIFFSVFPLLLLINNHTSQARHVDTLHLSSLTFVHACVCVSILSWEITGSHLTLS